MLDYLKLHNVGPAPELQLDLAPRLNVITGDNGLGKSFLLDTAWWALTQTWAGLPARPTPKAGEASLVFGIRQGSELKEYGSGFSRKKQNWNERQDRLKAPGLVLYGRVDGSFCLWDRARNLGQRNGQELQPAYVFSSEQLWNGLQIDNKTLCNGLIRDWVSWQYSTGSPMQQLQTVLKTLSPTADEVIRLGTPTRISLEDVRDIPTIRMPYGQDVPVLHAAAGMKRILGLAYLLVWAWQEHQRASELLEQPEARQITLLLDEIDAHLHPRWQRQILRSLLNVMSAMTKSNELQVQVITTTHSPLLLAALEPLFDADRDKLFHLGLEEKRVHLQEVPWAKQGDTSSWLVSEVFGLQQARSLEAERAIEAAEAFMRQDVDELPAGLGSASEIHAELQRVLAGHDPFWPRWIVQTGQVEAS